MFEVVRGSRGFRITSWDFVIQSLDLGQLPIFSSGHPLLAARALLFHPIWLFLSSISEIGRAIDGNCPQSQDFIYNFRFCAPNPSFLSPIWLFVIAIFKSCAQFRICAGRQNSRSFPVPIYRESKTRAVFSSRYIGKAKLAQFSRPDISGKQNSRSFPVPIYREGKSRAVFPSRYIGKAKVAQCSRPDISGRQKSRSFPVPIYREGKSRAVFPSRYIGKAKLAQFSRPDISGKQNSRSFPVPIYRESKTRAVFPSRYIGKAKVAQFSRPDISGKQKSRSFPVPIFRED